MVVGCPSNAPLEAIAGIMDSFERLTRNRRKTDSSGPRASSLHFEARSSCCLGIQSGHLKAVDAVDVINFDLRS